MFANFIIIKIALKPFGKAYATVDGKVEIFDIGDITFPVMEENALFFATHIFHIPEQQTGHCGPKCEENEECVHNPPLMEQICMPQQQCKILNWCPGLLDTASVKEYSLSNVENMGVKIVSSIYFP